MLYDRSMFGDWSAQAKRMVSTSSQAGTGLQMQTFSFCLVLMTDRYQITVAGVVPAGLGSMRGASRIRKPHVAFAIRSPSFASRNSYHESAYALCACRHSENEWRIPVRPYRPLPRDVRHSAAGSSYVSGIALTVGFKLPPQASRAVNAVG